MTSTRLYSIFFENQGRKAGRTPVEKKNELNSTFLYLKPQDVVY